MNILIGARDKDNAKVLVVDETKFADHVREYIWAYGLRQIINDAGASGKTVDEKFGMAQKRLDSLYAGELRKARGTGDQSPIEAEIERLARADAVLFFRGKGRKVKDISEDELEAKTAAFIETFGDEYTDKAAQAIEDRRLAAERAARMK